MKQPKLIVFNGSKLIGERYITQARWENGELLGVVVDFMQDGNSNDYLYFINRRGCLICNSNRNLTGKINN